MPGGFPLKIAAMKTCLKYSINQVIKCYSVIEHKEETDSYTVMSDIKLTFLCSQSINKSLNIHDHTFTNKPTAGIHKSSQKGLT